MKFPKVNSKTLLILIVSIGAVFRFYKLNWGGGVYPHPDENTVMSSVLQMSFPDQLHPHLFTYGSLITYLIFFTKLGLESFFSFTINLHPLLIGRFYSALLSTLNILIIYQLGLRIFQDKSFGVLAAFFVAFTPGLIQQAHFTTPETFQTFFLSLSLLFLVEYLESSKLIPSLLTGVSFGLALSSKISSVIIGPILGLALIIKNLKQPSKLILSTVIFGVTVGLTFIIISPYWILDFSTFKTTIEYESKIASGDIMVFYTRQFLNTTPVVFQLQKIYPFTLGPTLLILGILGFLGIIINQIKKPNLVLLILISSFLVLFLYNSFLFVKWTRYMAPTLPFFAIFASYFIYQVVNLKLPKVFLALIIGSLIFLHSVSTLSFFSIYTRLDSRVSASNWIIKNLPSGSNLIVEGANTTDVPLGGDFVRNSLFLYNLDTSPEDRANLILGLVKADYFIIQSRRVFLNHERNANQFPKVAGFYDRLTGDKLGFVKIKEFSSYPTFLNWEFPDQETSEETFTVFDHPVLSIYKKEVRLSDAEYHQILGF